MTLGADILAGVSVRFKVRTGPRSIGLACLVKGRKVRRDLPIHSPARQRPAAVRGV